MLHDGTQRSISPPLLCFSSDSPPLDSSNTFAMSQGCCCDYSHHLLMFPCEVAMFLSQSFFSVLYMLTEPKVTPEVVQGGIAWVDIIECSRAITTANAGLPARRMTLEHISIRSHHAFKPVIGVFMRQVVHRTSKPARNSGCYR